MATLLDNKAQGTVGNALSTSLTPNSRLSMLSALFSVYAFEALSKQLGKIDSARILIPGEQGSSCITPVPTFCVAGLSGSDVDRRFRNTLNLPRVAKACAQWLEPDISHPSSIEQTSFPASVALQS